jgi:hypothetical protein
MNKRLLPIVLASLFIATIALAQHQVLKVSTSKDKYLHYELVSITAQADPSDLDPADLPVRIHALVTRNGQPVTSIGQLKDIPLIYNPSDKAWEGKWPVPWNAPEATYTVEVDSTQVSGLTPKECRFEITRRKPPQIRSNLYILTLESTAEIKTMRIPSPEGKTGNWEQLIAWAKFMGANTVWYIGGQTAGWTGKQDEEFPWNKSNFAMLPKLAEEAHRNGLRFGVWVGGYLTFGKKEFRVQKYNYAYNYDEKKNACLPTARTISLADEKRKQDIIDFIKKVAQIPGVDYIGIDYIRNAFGGYEMVDEFFSDMRPRLPSEPSLSTKDGRMKWLAKKTIKRDDPVLTDQWNWWRAHYVAQHILKEIVEKSAIKQPLWVFTLSWEKGWQHGQDCIMMNDAGADIDAVMLYEADKGQFNELIKEWHNYVKDGEVNLVVGNQVDWEVHQKTVNPAGPEEFYNRLLTGSTRIYQDGPAKGMFFHDLARVFWGRIGPYSPMEWVVAGGAAFSQLRLKSSTISLSTAVSVPENIKEGDIFEVDIPLKSFSSKKIRAITVELLNTPGVTCLESTKKSISVLEANGESRVNFKVKITNGSERRHSRYMIAVVAKWMENEDPEKYFAFTYVQASNKIETSVNKKIK